MKCFKAHIAHVALKCFKVFAFVSLDRSIFDENAQRYTLMLHSIFTLEKILMFTVLSSVLIVCINLCIFTKRQGKK